MTTPKKHEILRRGKAIAMERQIRAGLPAITPSEQELKESGMFQEAQIDLMQVDQEALSEQRRYLEEMASDLRLKIIPKKGLATLKRETGYEWTNGWTKHEKPKPRPKKKIEPIDEKVISQYKGDPFPITRAELNQMKGSRALSREWAKFNRGIRLDAGRAIERRKVKPKPKKRKKSHVERSGKTMRTLRKIDGVKVFSFPDSVWKVRKPRKKRRKK